MEILRSGRSQEDGMSAKTGSKWSWLSKRGHRACNQQSGKAELPKPLKAHTMCPEARHRTTGLNLCPLFSVVLQAHPFMPLSLSLMEVLYHSNFN